jgi:NitT/TauT family transport system permease protein
MPMISVSTKGRTAERIGDLVYPLAAVIVVLVIWQVLIWASGIPSYVVPGPLDVVKAATQIGPAVLAETLPTLFEILAGFALAVIIGVPLGIGLAAFRPFERAFFPLIIALQGIPKVALAPLFVVWFGFGFTPKILLALLIAFFPVVVDTIAGIRSVNPAYLSLGRSMQGTKRSIYMKIVLPHALPQIFAGFKIAMSLAIIGAVVGELMGTNGGLGYILLSATGQLQMDRAFVVILWLGLISVPLVQSVSWLERLLIPWAPHGRNGSR